MAAGDLTGARNLLGPPLDAADPSPAHASVELAEAAGLHARVLVALGDPHAARGWAAFAYSAATRLYGTADQRTVATAATLAAVLHRTGNHTRAARLYRDVIIELTANDGPESLRVLAAHADLATVEYAQGECTLARNRLEDAWELHREVYGDGHPGGIRMLARLGAMQRDCGLFTRAHEHLALALELCREHLPADHPLAAQVAALARAAADPDHVCADPEPESADDPHAPTGRTQHAPEYAEPWHPEPRHAEPDPYPEPDPYAEPDPYLEPDPYPEHPEHGGSRAHPHHPQHSAVPPQAGGAATSAYPGRAGQHDQPYRGGVPGGFPDGGEHPPDAELPPRDELPPLRFPPPPPPRSARTGTDAPPVPPPRLPPAPLVEPPPRWAGPPPAGPPVPTPRNAANRSGPGTFTGAGPGGDADDDPEHGWWPPDVARRTPDGDDDPELGRRVGPASAEPWRPEGAFDSTSVVERPHRELPEGHPGDLGGAGGVPEVRHLPERRSSRLPVRIHRPQPVGRRLPPLFVAGLVGLVLLGTVAVVLGFGLTGEDEPEPPAPGPTTGTPAAPPSTPPPAAAGTPPGSVTLADNQSSVTLGWSYPSGATGPVVLAGGRTGQELRPFQELPAGSTGYVVYGLDTRGNYCFSVAVVYSESVVGEAEPVCTERPGRSPSAR
ncbi:tetratricopeptide repeat protein [Plantactinospora sp. BB1]|nr:tetratricopeptide repeat protein [Plantactinospora sp. BB1]AVT41587.1 tetratricopeptide repeat protein [Plantactinospora sp. BB1]